MLKIKHKNLLIIINAIIILLIILIVTSFNSTKKIHSNSTVINVYQQPNINSSIDSQIVKNETITIYQDDKNWLKVKFDNNKYGWIQKKDLNNNQISTPYNIAVKNHKNINLYTDTLDESKIIQNIPKDSNIFVLNTKNNFAFIKTSNNLYGWIKIDDLDQNNTDKINFIINNINNKQETLYIKNNQVKLYQKPNNQSNTIKKLKANEKVTKLNLIDGWYKIKLSSGQIGYIKSFQALSTEIKPLVITKPKSLQDKTIVIDPGHGGKDPGSITKDKRHEADATLQTSLLVKKTLEENGAHVILTREDDKYVTLGDRADISNKNKADAFICIHYDSTEKHNVASGTTTYYYSNKSIPLADAINQQLLSLPLKNKGVHFGDHQVTRDNNQPAVLLELGYLSNDNDANLAFSPNYQQLVANAILNGLENYFKQDQQPNSSNQ